MGRTDTLYSLEGANLIKESLKRERMARIQAIIIKDNTSTNVMWTLLCGDTK